MRNCRDIQADLSAYLDGELAPARRAEIEAHVAACADCQRKLAGLRTVSAGVAALPRLQPAPEFLADVRRKIAEGREPAASVSWVEYLFRPLWLKVPLEAAALILVAVLAVTIMKPRAAEKVATLETAVPGKPSSVSGVTPTPVPAAPSVVQSGTGPANEIAGETRRRISGIEGGAAGGMAMTVAPSPSGARSAQAIGIERSTRQDAVVVVAKNADDVKARAEELVARWNGKVMPGPQSEDAAGQVFLVELPRQCATEFKSELLRDRGTNAPAVSVSNGPRGGELTGYVETNDANLLVNRLERGVALKASSSITTVLEIRVVSPAR